jgi:hypothetical protein
MILYISNEDWTVLVNDYRWRILFRELAQKFAY